NQWSVGNKNDTLTNYVSGTATNVALIPSTTLYTLVSITDASAPTNQPFLVLNCSAKAKVSPGPGISPFAKIGNAIAKGTGLQETMQIGRLADSISENFTQALKKNKLLKDD
ncbi:MAG: hypothetical protein EBU92_13250, partial [Betaproteobacteria bacterium]|nr:hypothetical protein [Betaproteobacteria bacterium]